MTATVEDTRPGAQRDSKASRAAQQQRNRVLVRGICAAAAVASLVSAAAPTGVEVADRLWCAAFAAGVTYVASRAARASLVWLVGLTAVAAVGSWALAPALGALAAVYVANQAKRRRRRVARAAAGALASLALLNLPAFSFHGAPTLLAIAAVVPLLPSSYRRSPPQVKRWLRRILGWGLLVVTVVGIAAVGAAAMAGPSLVRGGDQARIGLNAAGDGAQSGSNRSFDQAGTEFRRASRALDAPWAAPARVLPIAAQHLRALSTAARSGAELADAAGEATSAAPYEELTAEGGQVDLDQLRRMQQPVRDAADALETAEREMTSVRSPWLLGPVARSLDDVTREVGEARPEVSLAADGLAVAPGLFGGDGDRRYLVLFTTPAETRNLGGFTGAYAVLDARNGNVDMAWSGSVADLVAPIGARSITGQDEFLERYGRYQPARYFQNVTASPDMDTVATVSAELFEQTTGLPVDGVVVADPFALEGLLELTGPVDVEGIDVPISAENVVQYLLVDQYAAFDTTPERRDRLQDIGEATFDALTDRSLPRPAALGAVLGPVVDGKHLMFSPFDPEERAFLDELGARGSFAAPEGSDFLSVRMANLRANKIDVYIHRDVAYDVTYDPGTGLVEGTVRVTVRNDAPAFGLPAYVLGAADSPVRQGTARMLTAIYTPLDAVGATLDGEPIGLEPQREAGAKVFTAPMELGAGEESVLVIELSGTIADMGDDYRLLASTQPLANVDQLSVSVSAVDGVEVVGGRGVQVTDGVAWATGDWATDERFRVRFR